MTSSVVGSGRCFSVSGSLGSMTETPGMPASAAQSFGWVTEALWAWDSCQRGGSKFNHNTVKGIDCERYRTAPEKWLVVEVGFDPSGYFLGG